MCGVRSPAPCCCWAAGAAAQQGMADSPQAASPAMARVNEGSGNPAGWLCNGPRLTDRGTGLMLPVPQPHFCWGFLLWFLFVCLLLSIAWQRGGMRAQDTVTRHCPGKAGVKGGAKERGTGLCLFPLQNTTEERVSFYLKVTPERSSLHWKLHWECQEKLKGRRHSASLEQMSIWVWESRGKACTHLPFCSDFIVTTSSQAQSGP